MRLIFIALLCLALGRGVSAQNPLEVTEVGFDRGRLLYQSHCGRCHGMLGLGGEGPNLARPTLPRAPDHASMVRVIRRGIAGTGMGGVGAPLLPALETDLVAAFVLSLGQAAVIEIPGDAERGRNLFQSAGDCYSCHIVDGQGKAVGPALTNLGLRRGADYLYESLRNPAADLPTARRGTANGFTQYLPIRAVTREGRVLNGMRVNEDPFSLQLMTVSGSLISLRKADLTSLEKRFDHSLMPATQDMTDEEVDDLVAYLVTLGGGS